MANNKSFTTVLDDNYIYISHLDEQFQFWKLPTWPDSVSDTMQSNFTPTNALGRTAPVYTFSNSGPRTVQISLPLHRDIMDEVNIGVSNVYLGEGEDYVDNLLNALQAIAVPKYNLQNKAVEPPLVALRLSNEIFIKGIVSGAIGVTYTKPILSNGKYAKIDISITISEVDPYDATSVFKNGGFRGVVQSLKKGMNLED
jgi:hypothetical protein